MLPVRDSDCLVENHLLAHVRAHMVNAIFTLSHDRGTNRVHQGLFFQYLVNIAMPAIATPRPSLNMHCSQTDNFSS